MEALDHPVLRLRMVAGLTQTQLADKVAAQYPHYDNISEQYIRRVEHGLVGSATELSHIFRELHYVITTRSMSEGRIKFADATVTLIAEYRNRAVDLGTTEKLHVDNNKLYMDIVEAQSRWVPDMHHVRLAQLTHDWYLLERLRFKQTLNVVEFGKFKSFGEFRRRLLVDAGGLKVASTYAFCSALKLHIFTVQRFAQQHGTTGAYMDGAVAANWPVDLRVALSQLGIDWSKIKFTGRDT